MNYLQYLGFIIQEQTDKLFDKIEQHKLLFIFIIVFIFIVYKFFNN